MSYNHNKKITHVKIEKTTEIPLKWESWGRFHFLYRGVVIVVVVVHWSVILWNICVNSKNKQHSKLYFYSVKLCGFCLIFLFLCELEIVIWKGSEQFYFRNIRKKNKQKKKENQIELICSKKKTIINSLELKLDIN